MRHDYFWCDQFAELADYHWRDECSVSHWLSTNEVFAVQEVAIGCALPTSRTLEKAKRRSENHSVCYSYEKTMVTLRRRPDATRFALSHQPRCQISWGVQPARVYLPRQVERQHFLTLTAGTSLRASYSYCLDIGPLPSSCLVWAGGVGRSPEKTTATKHGDNLDHQNVATAVLLIEVNALLWWNSISSRILQMAFLQHRRTHQPLKFTHQF